MANKLDRCKYWQIITELGSRLKFQMRSHGIQWDAMGVLVHFIGLFFSSVCFSWNLVKITVTNRCQAVFFIRSIIWKNVKIDKNSHIFLSARKIYGEFPDENHNKLVAQSTMHGRAQNKMHRVPCLSTKVDWSVSAQLPQNLEYGKSGTI